jgi:hypothetical protein
MASAPPRFARQRRALVTLTAAALVLTACSGSGFQYVQNDDFNAYFKLDEDWRIFEEEEFFASPALDLEPLERQRRLASTWVRGFDADPNPKLTNLFVNATLAPHGVARIQILTEAEREGFDVAALRAAHLGFDPVRAKREDPKGPVEVLGEESLSLDGGQHGVRLQVAFDTSTGDIAVIDQTALVDSARGLLYLFVIGCSSRCYAENQETIKEIADSWTIEESP